MVMGTWNTGINIRTRGAAWNKRPWTLQSLVEGPLGGKRGWARSRFLRPLRSPLRRVGGRILAMNEVAPAMAQTHGCQEMWVEEAGRVALGG